MSGRRFGDHEACGRCGMDIEFHGGRTWIGRGGETTCDQSGAVRQRDPDTGEAVDWPELPHRPAARR